MPETVSFRLDSDHTDLLDQLANDANTSRSNYLRQLVTHHLDPDTPSPKIEDTDPSVPYVTEDEVHDIVYEALHAALAERVADN